MTSISIELTDTPNTLAPSKVTFLAITVWLLSAVFYFYEFILQVSPSVMVPDLMQAFHIQGVDVGNLSAFYFYAYALTQMPAGMLIDRFGPRLLLTIAALSCAVGSLLFGLSGSVFMAELGRFLMGIGGGFAVVSCLKLTTLWFPSRYFALMAGFMVAVGMLGAAGGQAPLALLIESIGWQESILWGGGVGFVIAGLVWLIVRDHPEGISVRAHAENHSDKPIGMLRGLALVWRNPQMWIASVFAGLMFVPTLGFGELWGVPYLMERYPIDRPNAAAMCSTIFLGWVVGGPFFGWLSDRLGRRKLPLFISALGTLASILVILYMPNVSQWWVGAMFFILGAFSSGFVLAYSVVREISLPILSGTAIGFINTWNTVGGGAAQPLLGKLLDVQSNGQVGPDGLPMFTLEAYQTALISLPICIVLALLILPLIKETNCQSLASALKK